MGLDSHADTKVLGSNAIIMHYTNRECGDFSPCTNTYEPIRNVPIVAGASAVTSSNTGMTCILILNEAIWMGELLDHSLINPNQLCSRGVDVHVNPFGDVAMHIASDDGDFIHPMQADGITIFFESRTPTNHELDNCPHIVLSSSSKRNPREVQFPISAQRHSKDGRKTYEVRSSRSESESMTNTSIFDMPTRIFNTKVITCIMSDRMAAEVRIQHEDTPPDVPLPKMFATSKRQRWLIGLTQVNETNKVTAKNCVQSAVLPLSRRYHADQAFETPLLRGGFYTDTMDGRYKSICGIQYAQVFANKDFFALAFSSTTKYGAGDALGQFINEFKRPERL
jgi:hypothetical protein